jgi:transposase
MSGSTEVFTGSGQRRSWTAEQKARIVAEGRASGETPSVVAGRHGLTPQQLFGWRREARQAASGTGTEGPGFASVMIAAPTVVLVGRLADARPAAYLALRWVLLSRPAAG